MKLKSFTIILAMFLAGCGLFTELSPQQRRSIEAKELDGNFEDAFRATMAVLQDKGYMIDHTDYNAGVIKATSGKKTSYWGLGSSYAFNVSATIEQFGPNKVKERIVFLQEEKIDMGNRGVNEDSHIIEDPQLLQEMYDQIQKEMFMRKNLNK